MDCVRKETMYSPTAKRKCPFHVGVPQEGANAELNPRRDRSIGIAASQSVRWAGAMKAMFLTMTNVNSFEDG